MIATSCITASAAVVAFSAEVIAVIAVIAGLTDGMTLFSEDKDSPTSFEDGATVVDLLIRLVSILCEMTGSTPEMDLGDNLIGCVG